MSVKIHADAYNTTSPSPIGLTCPACGRDGTFEVMGQDDFYFPEEGVAAGHRGCPNPNCHVHVFLVLDSDRIVASYPPEVIDFDTTNVPAKVVAALSEAITCHANECYVAAAIMVRKTLEELCADRKAGASNLKEKIAALGTKVVIPKELLEGLDDLRLLGNDAAHIESKEYDAVGREEVEVGIEFTKEVLKAVYQMSDLLGRLRGLKAQKEATD